MVQSINKATLSILTFDHSVRVRVLAKINSASEKRCLADNRLQKFGTLHCPMNRYTKLICMKCFKEVESGQRLFRRYGHPGSLKCSKYMHLTCAEQYNYV